MSGDPAAVTIVDHGVTGDVVKQAAQVHQKIFGQLAPANAELLGKYTIELHIVPANQKLTDLPEYRNLQGKKSFEGQRTWDEIRGAGGLLKGTTIYFAASEEEIGRANLLGAVPADQYFPWFGREFLQLHESGHIIRDFGLTFEQKALVDRLHAQRTADPNAAWLPPKDYTSANAEEYFSNSVAAFFGASHSLTGNTEYSPDWLRTNDPEMYGLLNGLFPGALRAQAPTEAVPAAVARPAWDTVEPTDIPPELRTEGLPPPPPPPDRLGLDARGCLSRALWPVVGVIVAVLALVGAMIAFGGDDSDTTGSAGGGGALGDGCGALADGVRIDWSTITARCGYTSDQLAGAAYGYDAGPFRTATVRAESATQLGFGATCAIHTATAQELTDGVDPVTGFRGLSLIGVPISGLPMRALAEVVLRAPDGAVRTGRERADAEGYAEVHVPINVPQPHTIVSARYFPTGDASGAATEIAPTEISSTGTVAGAFPGNRCDRAATLAKAPAPTDDDATVRRTRAAALKSAPVFPILLSLANPGAAIDLGGPWTATAEDDYVEVDGGGVTFELMEGASTFADGGDTPPARIGWYGGTVVYPSAAGTGAAWDEAFPCGPGQLAFTVCTDDHAELRDVGYAQVGVVFDRPVPIEPDANATYTFTVGSETLELMARDGEWSLHGPPDSRAFVRNDAVFVLVPLDVAGGGEYRVSTAVGNRRDVQPSVGEPPVALPTVARAEPVAGSAAETGTAFVTALSTALTNGDAAFVRGRLHPAVIDRYGADACAAYASLARPPISLVADDVGPPELFAWQTDGLTRDVPAVNTVTGTRDGAAVTLHIALVDGVWRWFTDCGTPVAGAR